MRYVLIVNPVAGKRNAEETVLPSVRRFFEEKGLEYSCHVTEHPGHATELTAQEAGKGGEVRILGFGGDGTLGEIAAGAVGQENAEIGIFPCGSGNDYIKNFGGMKEFLSPESQTAGVSRPVDLIQTELGISISLCSVGMDAKVPLEVERLKRLPFLSGPAAYNLSVLKVLLGQLGDNLFIRIDDGEEFRDCFLFALAGSGRYYGGGYCGAPQALTDDGLLDFVLIRKPPLYKIPRLVGLYKAGLHIGSKEFEGLLTFRRGKKMEIFAQKPVAFNRDGEVTLVGSVSFRVLPHAIRFLVPASDERKADL